MELLGIWLVGNSGGNEPQQAIVQPAIADGNSNSAIDDVSKVKNQFEFLKSCLKKHKNCDSSAAICSLKPSLSIAPFCLKTFLLCCTAMASPARGVSKGTPAHNVPVTLTPRAESVAKHVSEVPDVTPVETMTVLFPCTSPSIGKPVAGYMVDNEMKSIIIPA